MSRRPKNQPSIPALTVQTAEPVLQADQTYRIQINTTAGESFNLPLGSCAEATAQEVRRFMEGRELIHTPLELPEFLSKVSVQFVLVTPRMALEWLQSNHTNRGLSWSRVNKYAMVMAQGNWKPTGEAIQFDTNGRLTDGQNRLWAVIKSDHAVTFLVVRGLDPSSQAVINQPLPRSAGAWLAHDPRFKGFPIRETGPVCREIMVIATGFNNLFGPEIVEAIALNYKREFLTLAGYLKLDQQRGQGYRVLSLSVVRAAVVIALKKYPAETKTFLDILVSGPSVKGSVTNIAFNYLYKARGKDSKRQGSAPDTTREVLLKMLWAITAHREGKKSNILAIPKANEVALFPYLKNNSRESLLPKGLDWKNFVKSPRAIGARSRLNPGRIAAFETFLQEKGVEPFTSDEVQDTLNMAPGHRLGGLLASYARKGRIEKVPGTRESWRVKAQP